MPEPPHYKARRLGIVSLCLTTPPSKRLFLLVPSCDKEETDEDEPADPKEEVHDAVKPRFLLLWWELLYRVHP